MGKRQQENNKRYSVRVRANAMACYQELFATDSLETARRGCAMRKKNTVALVYIFDTKLDRYVE